MQWANTKKRAHEVPKKPCMLKESEKTDKAKKNKLQKTRKHLEEQLK